MRVSKAAGPDFRRALDLVNQVIRVLDDRDESGASDPLYRVRKLLQGKDLEDIREAVALVKESLSLISRVKALAKEVGMLRQVMDILNKPVGKSADPLTQLDEAIDELHQRVTKGMTAELNKMYSFVREARSILQDLPGTQAFSTAVSGFLAGSTRDGIPSLVAEIMDLQKIAERIPLPQARQAVLLLEKARKVVLS